MKKNLDELKEEIIDEAPDPKNILKMLIYTKDIDDDLISLSYRPGFFCRAFCRERTNDFCFKKEILNLGYDDATELAAQIRKHFEDNHVWVVMRDEEYSDMRSVTKEFL